MLLIKKNKFIERNFVNSQNLKAGKSGFRLFSCAVLSTLVLGISASLASESFAAAAGPTDTGVPEEMSAEDYARLNDNTIEWDEIENIIKYRNPTYKTYTNQIDESIGNMKASASDDISDMKDQLDSIDDSIESIESAQQAIIGAGGSTSQDAYKKLSESLNTSKTLRNSVKSGLTQMGETSRSLKYGQKNSEVSLSPLRNQLTSVVKGLVISYKTLEANKRMAEEQVKLYETLYNTYQTMQAQSLATSLEVSTYKQQLDNAKNSLSQIDAGMTQLKGNILIQCGYESNASVNIADIPAGDRSFLSGRDIDADKKAAIAVDSSVKSAAKVSSYTGDVFKYRDANENSAEGTAAAKFDSIKADLDKQSLLCASSETAAKKAAILKNSAETKNALGMLGKGEYENYMLQGIVSDATAKVNELNLVQAIENYKYAVKGIM